jgi:hypothetical protein
LQVGRASSRSGPVGRDLQDPGRWGPIGTHVCLWTSSLTLVKICFGSFTATSTVLAAATSPTASLKVPATSGVAPSSGQKSKTHPPKPYDLVQGMECVIDMMEETLQICERAQHSIQDASHLNTFPFGLRPPSDVYKHQAAKSMPIQSGRQQPTSDLKVKSRARHDPLDVTCIYHKGARHTLRGCRLRRKIDQERDVSRATHTSIPLSRSHMKLSS